MKTFKQPVVLRSGELEWLSHSQSGLPLDGCCLLVLAACYHVSKLRWRDHIGGFVCCLYPRYARWMSWSPHLSLSEGFYHIERHLLYTLQRPVCPAISPAVFTTHLRRAYNRITNSSAHLGYVERQ